MELGKYEIRNNRLFNTEKQEYVPEEVFGFVLLSKDKNAAAAIAAYALTCENQLHREEVLRIARNFITWATIHPEMMREPDGLGI